MCYFSRKGASDDNHKRNLQELLKNFDCFGWVPTVGGALSLDIAGQFSCMLGDVDRHFAIFKNYIGLSSEQFITATSLVSVNDRKHGSIYDRNFRYFFLGSIHNSERNEDFINKHNLNKKSSIANFLNSEGALLGSLVIVLDKSYSLTKEEAEIIKLITGLEEQNKKYQDSFTIKADSLAELDNQRKSMKKTWLSIENKVSDIAKNQNYTSYTFDVFLTRDGILLLNDKTIQKNKITYCEKDTPSDYTTNIPLHRLFKCAMNYIKYLFHNNYHHNIEHDTYLPASNLHPLRKGNNTDFSKVFKHQYDALIQPIIRLKRNSFKQYPIDPSGIICYTKAFVNTCYYNSLISKNDKNRAISYINIQESEINHLTRHHKSLLSSTISNYKIVFIISAVLAMTAAVVKIAEAVIDIPKINIGEHITKENERACTFILLTMFIIFIGYVYTYTIILRKEFKPKTRINLLKRLCLSDSNLDSGKFSNRYIFYLWIQDKYMHYRKKTLAVLKMVVLFISFLLILYLIFRVNNMDFDIYIERIK